MDQKEMVFGEESYKLHRKDSLETSVESANNVNTTKLEEMVYEAICDSGEKGVIASELLEIFNSYPYSSITARFASLVRKGYVVRHGDKRKGKSGRNQLVMRKG